MDILTWLKNLSQSGELQTLLPVLNLLRENSFDLKRTLNNLTPETLMPIISALSQSKGENQPTASFTAENVGVTPIANVADKEIVYVLNRYLSSETAF